MSTHTRSEHATELPGAGVIEMRLEVVRIPVSDVDRAKGFYGGAWGGGWTPTSRSATSFARRSSHLPARDALFISARESRRPCPAPFRD